MKAWVPPFMSLYNNLITLKRGKMSNKKTLYFTKREEKLMEWCWDCESDGKTCLISSQEDEDL